MLRRLALILPLALLAATPLPAMEKGELEFALGADYYLFDSNAGLDNTLAPRVRFGFAVSDRVELELAYHQVKTKDGFKDVSSFTKDELPFVEKAAAAAYDYIRDKSED